MDGYEVEVDRDASDCIDVGHGRDKGIRREKCEEKIGSVMLHLSRRSGENG